MSPSVSREDLLKQQDLVTKALVGITDWLEFVTDGQIHTEATALNMPESQLKGLLDTMIEEVTPSVVQEAYKRCDESKMLTSILLVSIARTLAHNTLGMLEQQLAPEAL